MNNSNKEFTPTIKRVISVDRMGSGTLNRNNQITNKNITTDLNKLNPSRDHTFMDTLNRSKGTLLKDLFTATSELDSLKDKDFEVHKINPLFQLTNSNVNNKISNNNIVKIDVSKSTNSSSDQKETIRTLFDKNNKQNTSNKDKILNTKVFVKNSFKLQPKDNRISDDTQSIATTIDEPIYMDPIDILPSEFFPQNNNFNQKMSIKQNRESESNLILKYQSSVSTDDSSSIHDSPSNMSFRTNTSLYHFQIRKNSEILDEVKRLRNEMSQLFIYVDIKSTDLLYNLVIVNLYQKFWIGNLSSPTIGNYLHFGDQIMNVNGEVPTDIENLITNIKNSKNPIINLKLKRLPYCRIIFLSDIQTDLKIDQLEIDNDKSIEILKDNFGIKLKQNTAKIEKIYENGLFYKNGLKYDPNRVEFELETLNKIVPIKKSEEKERLTKWVITEINGDFINYRCSAEEVLARLKLNDTASVIVQPYDLIKFLFNQKKI